MKDYLLIAFVILMVLLYLVAIPLAKKKAAKKQQETIQAFQNELKKGDTVMMAAGIIGVIKAINPETISLEIANQTVIEIDKMSVVGKIK